MRIIKMLLVLAICVAALGFYRGWFSLSSDRRGPDNNQVDVTLTVDSDKVKEDAQKVKDETADVTSQVKDDAN